MKKYIYVFYLYFKLKFKQSYLASVRPATKHAKPAKPEEIITAYYVLPTVTKMYQAVCYNVLRTNILILIGFANHVTRLAQPAKVPTILIVYPVYLEFIFIMVLV